jgi:pyridoxal phosphate enzyme (YggS family)
VQAHKGAAVLLARRAGASPREATIDSKGPLSSVNALAENLRRAQDQVAEALAASGRTGEKVHIIGVSKYVDAELTRQLVEAGCRMLGESRPQSLWQKHAALADLGPIEWHMIGHLQRNKVARTLPLIDWLHSLDSLRLAETLNSEAAKLGKPIKVLIEVNATQDASKTGLGPSEVPALMESLLKLPALQIRGLMTMSTEHASRDQILREFTSVRELRDRLQQQCGTAVQLDQLSMGMSSDFPLAIAAGATMVRLGSVLWEGVAP